MATFDRIVFDGFRYEFEEMTLHAEGQRPKPCMRLTLTDEVRGYQAEAWFSMERWDEFKAALHSGVYLAEPGRRLGV